MTAAPRLGAPVGPKRRSGVLLLIVLLLSGIWLAGLVGVGVWWLRGPSGSHRPKPADAERPRPPRKPPVRTPPSPLEPGPPAKPTEPDDPFAPPPAPSRPPSRATLCRGAAQLTGDALLTHAAALGLAYTKDSRECDGSIINDDCSGLWTIEQVFGASGRVVLYVAATEADAARLLAERETKLKAGQSLVYEGRTVLMVELRSAESTKLLARICR
jgi:hypothetical protein